MHTQTRAHTHTHNKTVCHLWNLVGPSAANLAFANVNCAIKFEKKTQRRFLESVDGISIATMHGTSSHKQRQHTQRATLPTPLKFNVEAVDGMFIATMHPSSSMLT